MSDRLGSILFSIVAPMHNEAENVAALCNEVREALAAFPGTWELILVDDGSADRTRSLIAEEASRDARVRLVSLERRRGQSSALCAGFAAARGAVVGTIDGDLQNDPRDLPGMVEMLRARNVDMVTGWRRARHDHVIRRISSRIANGTRNVMTGDRIIDVGCSTRVFRRECLSRLPCYFDGMHRFFPTLFRMAGCTVIEVPVNHRPRQRGKAKYGVWNRLWRGIRDLAGVRWLRDRHLPDGKAVILSASLAEREESPPR
jgi:dolichol-phosphate mannosyltransferase